MIIELHDVSKAINGKTLFEGLNYAVVRGDRIGIIGRNGAGKSTLLNMLAGEIGPDNGSIEVGQTVKIAYYRQEIAEMDDTQRVIDYIKEAAEVIRTTDGSTVTAAQMLERFLFPGHLQWTPIGKLSGGEKRRLYLLRTLMGEPNVLLLDEPTNDLDIQTLAILEDYLEHFPGAVITVSHDRYFLDRTANHLFALEGNGEVNHFYGTYSDYMEHKKMQDALLIQGSKSSKEAPAGKPVSEKSKPKKLSYNEQKEWDSIEERITELEERADKLKSEIEAAGSDFAKVQQLFEEQQEVASELETALERWTYLSELVEEIERNKR